ncbi:CBS domain-containing protein [Cupriavidus sp. USMAHM13]|uniref:CBS domain-containing protein n=1 Tax=Cupriavidus sp. USMAHM13 TaxID=1389192 RepID=UPI001E37FEC8|nr:CBS domain-containing protein [Cupriavidus sp. USMAHM13]
MARLAACIGNLPIALNQGVRREPPYIENEGYMNQGAVMRVDEVLSRVMHHVTASCTIQEAARVMRDCHVKMLFVTEKRGPYERIIGVVTDHDMVVHGLADHPECGTASVSSVMTRGVVSIERQTAVSDALRCMSAHGVRSLAVRDGDHVVIGILSFADAMRSLGADMGLLTAVLQGKRNAHSSLVESEELRI